MNEEKEKFTINYIKEIIENKKSYENFLNDKEKLDFSDKSKDFWYYLIYNTYSDEYNHCAKISIDLINNDLFEVTELLLKQAVLNGYKIEMAKKQMESVENELNETMKSFYFTEKVKIVNEKMDDIYDLSKLIVNKSKPELMNELETFMAKYNIDITQIKLVNGVKKKLKIS